MNKFNHDALRKAYGKALDGRKSIDLPEGFTLDTELSADEQVIYNRNYKRVFDLTADPVAAMQAALGAVSRARYGLAVKSRKAEDGVIVSGWGIMFGAPAMKDLEDTFFAEDTDYYLEDYQHAPLWLEHGEDDAARWKKIGRRYSAKCVEGFGIYVEHLISPDAPAFADVSFDALVSEVESGEYAYSSDSLWHYVRLGHQPATGKLQAWPLAGLSLVRRPAEPGLGPVVIRQVTTS